ncbi:NUDIX domain-containing protein [Exiguobacterium sp. MH3]|uniref:NUDIX domain-containing protein n=1 Tax=Exiguobacterium sp. MH3 TaxID=1399115 RepID=UPI0003C3EB34|nr:NUDIX domain-containing protein [Exiguobacterium sp. MH3]AHA31097.1 NUDIX hydrolase [Exiguobacterium sp. MH3]
MRHRVCAALIEEQQILMVELHTPSRTFWTLPGGGVESGETKEQAVVREVLEETHLHVTIERQLYEISIDQGTETCFLVRRALGSSAPQLGIDPELPFDQQELRTVRFRPLKELHDDPQIARLLTLL